MRYISLKRLLTVLKKRRLDGEKIVFTNGCFDIIHSGHIKVLREAKKLGDILVVGLNSDSSVKKLKGRNRPVNLLKDRIEVLSAIKYVDYIVVFNKSTPYNLIKKIKPDFLVKGGDYKEKDIVGRQFSKKVVTIPLVKDKSTTNIIERIKKIIEKK